VQTNADECAVINERVVHVIWFICADGVSFVQGDVGTDGAFPSSSFDVVNHDFHRAYLNAKYSMYTQELMDCKFSTNSRECLNAKEYL
ncbi:MAG: hypothetical protein AAGF06_06135, partial [Pseudomonadota bacterium]